MQKNENKTPDTKSARKLSFKSRFIKNPIDEKISKQQILKIALDKKESKELLTLLDKRYYVSKSKRIDNTKYDYEINIKKVPYLNTATILTIYTKKLIEEEKNKPDIDLKFRKQLKKIALVGKIPDDYRKDVRLFIIIKLIYHFLDLAYSIWGKS